MKHKAILFDFDLTLVDSFRAGKIADQALTKALGIKVTGISERKSWGMTVETFAAQLARLNNNAVTPAQILKVMHQAMPVAYTQIPFREKDVLKKLRKHEVKLGVLTNNIRKLLNMALKNQLNRDFHFDLIYSHEDRQGKTKAKMLEMAAQHFKVSSSELIYIGDHPEDIKAAKKAGVFAVGITTGLYNREELAEYQPDLIVDSFAELYKKIYEN